MRGVLLLAHGTPDTLDQMPAYLARVRGGRPPSPELVEEMTHNYAAIGGRSPLTDLTRRAQDRHQLLRTGRLSPPPQTDGSPDAHQDWKHKLQRHER